MSKKSTTPSLNLSMNITVRKSDKEVALYYVDVYELSHSEDDDEIGVSAKWGLAGTYDSDCETFIFDIEARKTLCKHLEAEGFELAQTDRLIEHLEEHAAITICMA